MKKDFAGFKGYDWQELCDYWNIEISKECIDNDTESKPLVDFIKKHWNSETWEYDSEVVEVCREYLKSLVATDFCGSPQPI